ncbi:hypothetical protein [Glutamicibacter sp. AOP5-A2-18]|uniref:hypothetical protein n=1 Tax=Glutamicibacter sp. AOP5-A2-18 TaxID=3457656 RepID=UPI0040344F11
MIALAEDGDTISIDIPTRELTLNVSEEVLTERRERVVSPHRVKPMSARPLLHAQELRPSLRTSRRQ